MKDKIPCSPVIQWAGGKRQLLPDILNCIPKEYGTYYEPFFGGGALFFELQPNKAIVNDNNPMLINVYNQIKTNCKQVALLIDRYQDRFNSLTTDEQRKGYYYSLRKKFNEKIKNNELSPTSAALFIFINRACFNALYRVNKNGEFNVPLGSKKKINAYGLDNFQAVSQCLKKVELLNGDFEEACKSVETGDFVFFDSPYWGTFDTYQAGGFTPKDHERLADLYKQLSKNGVYCMLTNSNTEFIKSLYSDYNIEIVNVKRNINSEVNNRVGEEIIVTNYKKEGENYGSI